VQLVNPTLSGWSNGTYSGRTKGIVQILGGTFVNNWNCQVRIGGGSIVDGASMLLDDRKWSRPGPFEIGHQGVYAVRVDAKHGNTTDPAKFVNLRIVANSMREGAALFDWESVSGPGIIRNCHITNHLDRPVVLGESPSVSGPTNIMVDQSLIDGSSSAGVMECHDRPQSMIRRTCITTPDAGPEDIDGAQIGPGMGFGQCTGASGLAAPKKVGSGGNISSLPAPTNPSSPSGPGPDNPAKEGPSKGVFVAVIDGIFLLLLMLLGMVVLFVAGILGALGALAAMVGGD
jgi:hypothetical protein